MKIHKLKIGKFKMKQFENLNKIVKFDLNLYIYKLQQKALTINVIPVER